MKKLEKSFMYLVEYHVGGNVNKHFLQKNFESYEKLNSQAMAAAIAKDWEVSMDDITIVNIFEL